jgi:DNA-binding CsgD family transcriptional regulator
MATLSDFTPREEVIRLVLAGRTNKVFAAQISISEKTVQFSLIRSIRRACHETGTM